MSRGLVHPVKEANFGFIKKSDKITIVYNEEEGLESC